jgi:hypothetical protein
MKLKESDISHIEMTISNYFPNCDLINIHAIEINANSKIIWEKVSKDYRKIQINGFLKAVMNIRTKLGQIFKIDKNQIGELPDRIIFEKGFGATYFTIDNLNEFKEVVAIGEHKFSQYVANFYLEEIGSNKTRLYQVTRANFPGIKGKIYLIAVLLFHDVIVEDVLNGIKNFIENKN